LGELPEKRIARRGLKKERVLHPISEKKKGGERRMARLGGGNQKTREGVRNVTRKTMVLGGGGELVNSVLMPKGHEIIPKKK